MTDTLEDELRAALIDRAASLSPRVLDGLARTDFWARSRRGPAFRLPFWSAVGTAIAAVAAGIIAAVVLLSSGAPAAWAGWTPTPTTPTAAAATSAAAACKAMNLPRTMTETMAGTPVLTDQRGPYTAAIYESNGNVSDCISNGTRGKGTYADFSALLKLRAVPGPDQLGAEVSTGGGGSAPSHLEGLAGSDITTVTFIFTGGAAVDATVQNGWYFAWWPKAGLPTTVKVTTATGKTIISPMAGRNCKPGSSTCAFAGNRPGGFASNESRTQPGKSQSITTTTP
jgi:hypothetical protein